VTTVGNRYDARVILTDAFWPDIDAGPRRLLIVPVGSLEQHGPHLPLDTDTRIAVAVTERAVDAFTGVALAPPIAIGASGEHAGFPGTLSIGTDALTTCLIELGRHASIYWPAMLLANGHGGNIDAVAAAVAKLTEEGRTVRAWHASTPGGDPHAGRAETSVMLALAPDSVRLSAAAPGETRPLRDIMPLLREGGVRSVSPNGVLGDPAGASPAEGAELLGGLVARLRSTITDMLAELAPGDANSSLSCWE
jgi:mycofactocin system creatininase family protein